MLLCLVFFVCGNMYHKNDMFKRCFQESVKCKMTAQTRRKDYVCCQNPDFTLYVIVKSSIFNLRPLFGVPCLINSLYRRCVSCMQNISNISPKYQIFFIYSIHTIHSVIRLYMLGLNLSYFPCRVSSSQRKFD